ncbi:olfactory receptor 6M1-like [Dasypus novemcinctus]|uniref:olfactory receptor 6M1-like n=1 Tax=Dasypus novemcinctus TaxID=9361 RepID=UPI0039C9E8D9
MRGARRAVRRVRGAGPPPRGAPAQEPRQRPPGSGEQGAAGPPAPGRGPRSAGGSGQGRPWRTGQFTFLFDYVRLSSLRRRDSLLSMERGNWTMVTEVILIGIPTTGALRGILFFIFLLAYLVTVLGNTLIITLIFVDYRLHSPMYFFLSNLSFSEILTTTCAVPKMLAGFLSERNRLSFSECFTQSYFYFLSGCTEFILFAVMSYDRYVAICSPLQYPTIMTSSLCIRLVILSWVGGFSLIFPSTILKAKLPYCGPNEIDHFFCDSAPLLHLACADIRAIKLMDFLSSLVLLISSLSLTVISYVYIISTILKIPSGQGQQSLCHLCLSLHCSLQGLWDLHLCICPSLTE